MELKLGRIGSCVKIDKVPLTELQASVKAAGEAIVNYAANNGLNLVEEDIICVTKGGKLYFYYDPE